MDHKEITNAAGILSKIEPGFLPLEIYKQVVRIWTNSCIELVIYRMNKELEIFMIQRDINEKYWPGMWHVPGCSVLVPDEISNEYDGFESTLKRLMKQELEIEDGLSIIHPTQFKAFRWFSGRDKGISTVFIAPAPEDFNFPIGKFIPLSEFNNPNRIKEQDIFLTPTIEHIKNHLT